MRRLLPSCGGQGKAREVSALERGWKEEEAAKGRRRTRKKGSPSAFVSNRSRPICDASSSSAALNRRFLSAGTLDATEDAAEEGPGPALAVGATLLATVGFV